MAVRQSFVNTPHVRQFLNAFKMDLDLLEDLDALIEACSSRNTRFQDGRDKVRFQFERDHTKWEQPELDAIYTLSESWGMRHGETSFKGGSYYDLIITLGGARLSPWQRAAYAALAISEGRTRTRALVIGGSTRHLPFDELPFIKDYVDVDGLLAERNNEVVVVGGEEKSCLTEEDLCNGAEAKIRESHPGINVVAVCVDKESAGNLDVIANIMTRTDLYPASRSISVAGVTAKLYETGADADLRVAAPIHNFRSFDAIGHPVDPIYLDRRTPRIYFNEILTTLRKKALAEKASLAWMS